VYFENDVVVVVVDGQMVGHNEYKEKYYRICDVVL
jgi:hypothetical protein